MKQRRGFETTCCNRHLESLGCRTTPLEHWSKRKPTVEPRWRWAKQQTKKLWPQSTKINSFTSGPSLSLTPDPPACISILRTNAENFPLFLPRYAGKSFVSVLQCPVVVLHISCCSNCFLILFIDN